MPPMPPFSQLPFAACSRRKYATPRSIDFLTRSTSSSCCFGWAVAGAASIAPVTRERTICRDMLGLRAGERSLSPQPLCPVIVGQATGISPDVDGLFAARRALLLSSPLWLAYSHRQGCPCGLRTNPLDLIRVIPAWEGD